MNLTRKDISQIPDNVRLKGRAKFDAPDTLSLEDGRIIKADAIVIATGASPHVPEAFANLGHAVLTNDSIFDLQDLPASLAVIGSGAIGLELAQAMARLGVTVTLFDEGSRLGGVRCNMVHAALEAAIREDVTVVLGVKLKPKQVGKGAL